MESVNGMTKATELYYLINVLIHWYEHVLCGGYLNILDALNLSIYLGTDKPIML